MSVLVRLFFVAVCLFSVPVQAGDVRDLAERLEAKASNGDESAAYKLGLLFSDGKKIAPDYYTAIEWYEKSAQAGYVKAMLKLADIYMEGKGDNLDLDKAKIWNERAAKKGSRKAMAKLGLVFAAEGNYSEAAFWYKKAAIKGDPASMREMGVLYLKGQGLRFDLSHAYAWLELAVKKGDHGATPYQREIIARKGQAWADQLVNQMENRMIPEDYWDAN